MPKSWKRNQREALREIANSPVSALDWAVLTVLANLIDRVPANERTQMETHLRNKVRQVQGVHPRPGS